MSSYALHTTPMEYLIPGIDHTCKPPGDGPKNVDGKCIKGGHLWAPNTSGWYLPETGRPSSVCAAFPVYVQSMVPYTNGSVSGSDFEVLAKLRYAKDIPVGIRADLLGNPTGFRPGHHHGSTQA